MIPFSRNSLRNWHCSEHVYMCNLFKEDMNFTCSSWIKPSRSCSYQKGLKNIHYERMESFGSQSQVLIQKLHNIQFRSHCKKKKKRGLIELIFLIQFMILDYCFWIKILLSFYFCTELWGIQVQVLSVKGNCHVNNKSWHTVMRHRL